MAGIRIPVQRTTSDATSLTQPGARTGRECAACGSERVTRLAMTLTDGTPVQFTSCHVCEHRTWTHEGDALSIDLVLSKATKARA